MKPSISRLSPRAQNGVARGFGRAVEWLTNKIVPDSWNYLRTIKENEINKTTALAFSIQEASAKIRTGMPVDEEEDLELPIWSGLIPIRTMRQTPIADSFSGNIPLPAHLKKE